MSTFKTEVRGPRNRHSETLSSSLVLESNSKFGLEGRKISPRTRRALKQSWNQNWILRTWLEIKFWGMNNLGTRFRPTLQEWTVSEPESEQKSQNWKPLLQNFCAPLIPLHPSRFNIFFPQVSATELENSVHAWFWVRKCLPYYFHAAMAKI